jgi:integrase
LYNDTNERAKYKYRIHKKRVGKKDAKTIIADLKHIRDYEIFTGFKDFSNFNDNIADKYINDMFSRELSLSYILDNLRALREFLSWLERQRGYKKINYNHIEYLNITNNQRKTAKATEYKKSYKYEQILTAIRLMPEKKIMQKRNKAIVSLQALCGLRISELRTVKIKNLICEDGVWFIHVNPKDMVVKIAKPRQANFMPLPQDIIDNILLWREYLLIQGFTAREPLFPQFANQFNQHNLLENNITHTEIKSNTTLRKIFEKAFTASGYEYIRPHSFRHTIIRFAEKQTPGFLNACRQSLGHRSIDVSFSSYGQLSDAEQRERITCLVYEFDR